MPVQRTGANSEFFKNLKKLVITKEKEMPKPPKKIEKEMPKPPKRIIKKVVSKAR